MIGMKSLLHLSRLMVTHLVMITTFAFLFASNSFALGDVKALIKDFNTQVPMKLDKDLELTNVELNNKTVIYNLRLFKLTEADLNLPIVKTRIKESVPAQVCKNKNTRELLDNGYNILYKYNDKNKKLFTQLEVKLSDCH